MQKKASSKPMLSILKLLTRFGDIEIVPFPEEVILGAPVEEWPHPVDALISFFSDGFPLDKAEAYCALRQPALVNDVTAQRILLDRGRVYSLLEENGIPHPDAVFVERDPETQAVLNHDTFEEGDDFLLIGDKRIAKPFVEKPFDAEDHNICIYYPSSAGGGVKRLFRKVENRSSCFDPDVRTVRTDRSYLYEPFMKTQGTDIKVYTVGAEYAHAEARKSPVIDGVVNRNEDGKEVRYPVVLTPKEKEMARRVCLAFGQWVCGFDLLRTTNGSYVIDVNGWSFVKGIPKYYEDAANLLRAHILTITGRAGLRRVESVLVENAAEDEEALAENSVDSASSAVNTARSDRWEHEELLAVLAVMRHGDRTPKNKVKLVTSRSEFLKLHRKWASGPKKEVKLKAPKQLQEVLDLTHTLLGPEEADDSKNSKPIPFADLGVPDPTLERLPLDDRTMEACKHIRVVLAGGHFDGIYRKVQIKPVAWAKNEQGEDEASEVMVVLKYGGILTHIGEKQAEQLGHVFREEMYPGEDDAGPGGGSCATGLLRLHATQRHDFKVYSSDEGRVQMSAAAFARGLLDLEGGSLTPICVALVETDSMMLDDLPSGALPLIEEQKQKLYERITAQPEQPQSSVEDSPKSPPTTPTSMGSRSKQQKKEIGSSPRRVSSPNRSQDDSLSTFIDAMDFRTCGEEQVPSLLDSFKQLQEHIQNLCKELEDIEKRAEDCSKVTKPTLVQRRWLKLREDLWDKKHNVWNVSKLPEIRDAVRFDLIHHPRLAINFRPVWEVSKHIGDVIVPREYGFDPRSRVKVGAVVCGKLLRKLLIDLSNSMTLEQQAEELPSWNIATALYNLRRATSRAARMVVDRIGPARNMRLKQPVIDENAQHAEAEEEECKEAEFAGLDTRLAGQMRSPHRRVRTRLYFTSESHIQTLMNVLRYCHLSQSTKNEDSRETGSSDERDSSTVPDRIVCPEVEEGLRQRPIFDYLTQIVFRLYEDKRAPQSSPERFRVEVLFSPGAASDPEDDRGPPPLEKLQPLHDPGRPLTYARLQELLSPFSFNMASNSFHKRDK